MNRMPLRRRVRVAWNMLRRRPVTLDHADIDVELTGAVGLRFHACINGPLGGPYALVDNCDPPCEAQEAYILGGDIWERYAMDVEQNAGPDGVRKEFP